VQSGCSVVDDFTHDSLAPVADTSISSVRVGRELDAIISRHSKPRMIIGDGGTELTSMAILRWSQAADLARRYIAPSADERSACGHITHESAGSRKLA
jgi:putative transposase